MPVTAKLSKAFYDKIGEQPANDLVNWMNAVHEDARADLREFNELNFARFDAKLDQRMAGIEARIDGLEARFDGLAGRFVGLDARFDELDARFDRLEARFDRLEAKVAAMPDTAMIDAKLAAVIAQIDARLERMHKEMVRFVFFAWMTTLLIPIIGFWMRR